jgi:hypothetical protein
VRPTNAVTDVGAGAIDGGPPGTSSTYTPGYDESGTRPPYAGWCARSAVLRRTPIPERLVPEPLVPERLVPERLVPEPQRPALAIRWCSVHDSGRSATRSAERRTQSAERGTPMRGARR